MCTQHSGDFFPLIIAHLRVLICFTCSVLQSCLLCFHFSPTTKPTLSFWPITQLLGTTASCCVWMMCGAHALKPGRNQNVFPRSCRVCINLKETKMTVFSFLANVTNIYLLSIYSFHNSGISFLSSPPLSNVPCLLKDVSRAWKPCQTLRLSCAPFCGSCLWKCRRSFPELISPPVAVTDECTRSSRGTLMLPTQHRSDGPEVSASKTPKNRWHQQRKAKYYPNIGFYQEQRHKSTRKWDCSGEEGGNGAARWRLLGGLLTRRHQREEECGEIDNWDGKKDERRAKKKCLPHFS